MAAPVGPTRSPAPAAPADRGVVPADWPAQAADTIVDSIAKVRDKTTRPAIVAARAVVYGLLAAIVGMVALVMFLVLLVRLWSNYVPGDVWWCYLLLFVLMTPAGLVLLRRANRPAEPTS